MMGKNAILKYMLALLCAAQIMAVQAADLDYRYAEVRYQRVDLDNGVDGDGIGASGWYRFHPRLFAVGDLASLDIDGGTDITLIGAGLGTITPLSSNWDGIAMVMLRRADIDGNAVDITENGYAVQLGVRGQPGPKLEARAFLNYVDVGGSDTSVTLSGDYYFTPAFSAGAAFNFGGDADTLSIGGRFYFGAK